ncbi:Nudix family hydrolase [Halomonas sp. 22501_18_FS]|uniref:8-oxo-dGTP diphosphatase n=1 Tax=Vreelandella halophila TaxID=86177 RepID=A0A9X4YB38_9GAMM|nr:MULTISPECIES: Nudix family hydrolase [Halomonas]MYL26647.1 Nudix family hydrolase [Halomonas utahensis]MYL73984.1 Nudix family hydrolase [Halomonas sp. 22501_18_FS]
MSTSPSTPNTGPESVKTVHVAVAAVSRHEGGREQVLVAQRHAHQHQGGLLEFPGGKVEPGESAEAALVRELDEEVGLRVPESGLGFELSLTHDYGDRRVQLDLYRATGFSGEPQGREDQPLMWLDVATLDPGDFPAANRRMIQVLALPARTLVTGAGVTADELADRLRGWAGSQCLLRCPELDDAAYQGLASACVPVARNAGCALVLHGAPERLAAVPDANGLHLPWREARALMERPISSAYRLGVSCHDRASLEHAQRLGADYAFLSPVRPTASHPERSPLGWDGFEALVAELDLPVYALGGVGGDDVVESRRHGGCGVAGIGFWWH